MYQDDEPYYRFHIEHIIAKQHGGRDGAKYRALACRTGNIVLLFHPRRQKWERHFRWFGARVIGRTQCGRATVALLKMNLADRVELRKRLRDDLADAP
jgi:hypothetical protein